MHMVDQKLHVLKTIAEKLNDLNVLWNIGASCMLFLRGVVSDFDDIDIMVEEKDATKVKCILETLGTLQPKKSTNQYLTTYFYEFEIAGVDVDLMAGYKVINLDKVYEFPFDEHHIDGLYRLDGIDIPLASIDDWFVYYKVMNRHDKVKIIKAYLKRLERQGL